MGYLFDAFMKGFTGSEAVSKPAPKFFMDDKGGNYGTILLKEGQATRLPRKPENLYRMDGQYIKTWYVEVFSTTKNEVLKYPMYEFFIPKLKPFVIESDAESVTVRAMSLKELRSVIYYDYGLKS